MENKKSFGEFIQQKRKEAGLTQKAFAAKLFVTESAVSKWERGESYPDITLIRDICENLNLSEHELLNASEDTQTRRNEKLAKKYTSLMRRIKLVQIIVYALALLTCFICNLAVQHTLSWFFIVLTSIAVAASLTLLPVILEKNRAALVFASFTASLLALLLVCNIYTGGGWFIVAAVSVLFGLCVVFLPFALRGAWLPPALQNHKALLSFAADTLLLILLLFVCNVYTNGGWFLSIGLPIALFCLAAAWGIMLIIRYVHINRFFKASACLGVAGLFWLWQGSGLSRILGQGDGAAGFAFNFRVWNFDTVNANINMLVLLVLLSLTIVFAVAGAVKSLRRSKAV